MARQIAEVLALMNARGVQVRLTSAASVFVTGKGERARPLFPECALTLRGELADKSAFQLSGVVALLIAPQAGPVRPAHRRKRLVRSAVRTTRGS